MNYQVFSLKQKNEYPAFFYDVKWSDWNMNLKAQDKL